MKLKHFLLTALILFTGVGGVYAGKHYVGFLSGNTDGNNLQAALMAADAGNDTVCVATGLYIADAAEFTVPEGVTLIGGYNKGSITEPRHYPGEFVPFDSSVVDQTKFTILDGNAYKRSRHTEKHRVITVKEGGVVDGCLIRNGHIRNGNGGGVLLDGGKLYNSIVRGNVAMSKPDTIESLGGGVFIQNGGELINCLVAYNMANDGYGVAAGTGGGKMINNTITANTYSPVFAKIPGGKFNIYKVNEDARYHPDGAIPKWDANDQLITMNDFYLSRILTTEGQYAVFCAAMDIPKPGTDGQLNIDTLKNLKNPVKTGTSTIEDHYKIGTLSSALQPILQKTTNVNSCGLNYGDGIWYPIGDTSTVEYPMGYVTWYGALAYSVWLGGGLPTEAQWQFAARREPDGVNDNLYSGAYGSTVSNSATDNNDTVTWRILDTIAWVAASRSIDTATGKLGVTGTSRPHEVARKRPNAMGIYDMTGNVNEWCADWFDGNPGPFRYATYPTDPIYNTIFYQYRVTPGGGYPNTGRPAFALPNRPYSNPVTVLGYYGFRPTIAF